ncbi:hypothetical protein [Winogradskyella thalassocola]|uniref:Membrane domain of glycerophosphoryl diester phosphodiesterase n=1 Tax=Winogradskyella thalassocola TaxID=262004 RepID=A0A1G7ZJT1_9FLAO|nr:hypothetical protein [Winogradskyella thalassocola]SDH08973.1 hypothetical protein SAMN04489796_1011355 [Winogradskyella thalassocola]
MNSTQIKSRIENANALDFGIIFNQSIELFKKVWVQGLVTLLLNMVLAIPVIMIVYIPLLFLGFANALTIDNSYDSYDSTGVGVVFGFVFFIVYIFLIVAMSAIGLGLKAAFYRICKFKDLEQMGKEDYFYFFKKPYLGKTIKLGAAFTGIALLATLLCFIPIIYAVVPLSFIVVVYAFNPDLSISEIIKLGFDLGNKKWLISFGLMFVSGFLAMMVGFLMCGFGIYVTSSFGQLPSYFIYKDVVGFDEEDDQMRRIEQLSTF